MAVEEYEVEKMPFMAKNIATTTPIIFQQRSVSDMSDVSAGCSYDFSNEWVRKFHEQVRRYF